MGKQELIEKFLVGKATEDDFYSLGDYLEEQDDEFLGWEEAPPLPTDEYNTCVRIKRRVFLDRETGIYYGVRYYTDAEEDNIDLSNSILKIVIPLNDTWEEV